MNFWEIHDQTLAGLKRKAVQLREEFERGNDVNDKNYYKRLNRYINRKIGKPTDLLCKLSMAYTLSKLNSPKTL